MKALIPLLIVSTSALAVTTVQYARHAQAERGLAQDAQAVVRKQELQIRELQQAQGMTLRGMQAVAPFAEAGVQARSTLERAPEPAPTKSLALAAPPAAAIGLLSRVEASSGGLAMGSARALPFMPLQQQLSPAAQRYMRMQMKTSLRRQYEDLGPAMGLPQEQADKFVDLLLEQQTRQMGEVRKLNVDMKEAMQAAQENKRRSDAEIAALLGPNKLPAWEEYQKSMPDRSRVNMVRDQMQTVGTPLTDDQRARLLDIVVANRQSNPAPVADTTLPPEEMFAQSMKWQEETDRALLKDAKSVLTPAQYENYRDYYAWQSEMRSNSIRSFRMMPPIGGAPGAGNSAVLMADPPLQAR